MVMPVRRNFSLIRLRLVMCCCVLGSIEKLYATSVQEGPSLEGGKNTPPAAAHRIGGDFLEAKGKPRGGVLPTSGKPVARTATASIPNFEKLETWPGLRKNSNNKLRDVNNNKDDSVIFPRPAVGVSSRTPFTENEVNDLIPDDADIENCKLNAIAGTSLCNVTRKYPTLANKNEKIIPDLKVLIGEFYNVNLLFRLFIRNVLSRKELAPELFGNDLLAPELGPNVVDTRFQHEQPGFKNLCNSREFLHFPKMGKTAANEWKYILQNENDSQRYVQGIRVEVCTDENKKCDLVEHIPNGYAVQCIQKFVYRRLVAISPKDKSVSPDNFEFPSCCVCVYKPDLELRSTFGKAGTSVSQKPASPKPTPSKPASSNPLKSSPPRG